MSNEKKIIENRVLQRARSCSNYQDNRWRWGEIKKILMEEKITLQDDDIIEVGYTEGWDEGDSARVDMYDLAIIKCRVETDEEYDKRMKRRIEMEEASEKRKYENYLKLKKHYEG